MRKRKREGVGFFIKREVWRRNCEFEIFDKKEKVAEIKKVSRKLNFAEGKGVRIRGIQEGFEGVES